MSDKLSLLDDNSDSEVELTINKSYANSYQEWRKKEELQKCKDLEKAEEDSESSSESEDEIPEFDEEFFRALSLVKGKDPRIYDKNFHLFQEKKEVNKPKVKKEKPVYLKDYERNLVLERGGEFSDEEESNIPEKIPIYDEEQEKIRKSFKDQFGGSDDSDSDGDELLKDQIKTEKEVEDEEANYVKWLKGEEEELSEDVKKDMSHLRNYWNNPKLDENEKFLRDYILNKRYLEKGDSENLTYEEPNVMLSDDEKMIEEQEKFEHKYNFRFEEPDEEFIKRYPRTVGDSLRRADTRRKQKREEIAERKKREKEQRKEELKRLKALKRKEIEEKFMKLKEISGQDEINLNESDIESDFDPDKHDQKMREMFNEEYYEVGEEQKPEFPYDEELDSENWNKWVREKSGEDKEDESTDDNEENDKSNLDDQNGNPEDDFGNEMLNAARPKKKMKKKSLFAKIISQPKPIYDPDGKPFSEYLDEYYKLDYEDVIGDLPVRYKYRQVIPNDFGLTVDEILAADDRELNRWCSVKKTCQYRDEEEELYDVQAFRKKAENPFSKKKCLPSVYTPEASEDPVSHMENSKKKKKYNKEAEDFNNSSRVVDVKEDSAESNVNESLEQTANENENSTHISEHKRKSKKQKNKKKGSLSSSAIENEAESTDFTQNNDTYVNEPCVESSVCDDNEQDLGQPHKQFKKTKKHRGKQNVSAIEVDACTNGSFNLSETSEKSSKRKRNHTHSVSKAVDNDISIEVTNSNSNIIPENTFEEPPIKKKKKKKHTKSDKSVNAVAQSHKSNLSSNKHKKHASGDKRLDLPDERLAAYGINPKKFKNRIIYSQK